MSTLLARIVLAFLVLPLAAFVELVLLVVMLDRRRWLDENVAFLVGGLVTAAFVAIYWLLLWRSTVRWTPSRRTLTVVAGGVALVPGLMIGGLVGPIVDPSFGIFVAINLAILVWMALTLLVWRESARERAERHASIGVSEIVCPACEYRMTGLTSSTCPECGARFTLDQLFASAAERRQSLEEQS